MRRILLVPLLLAIGASAEDDRLVDRLSIDEAIASLNRFPLQKSLFATGASIDLAKLPEVKSVTVRKPESSISLEFGRIPGLERPGHMEVVVSKEPWGEAQLVWVTDETGPPREVSGELMNPRISGGEAQFSGSDTARVEGRWRYLDGDKTQVVPLVFVLKREGDKWKFTLIRIAPAR